MSGNGYEVMVVAGGRPVKMWTHGVPVEDGARAHETPAAYKDIDAVMAAQGELVEIVATLKQVLCVKG